MLWWFVGTVLIVLSFVLWLAGLTGREGVLRIGKEPPADHEEMPKAQLRSANVPNIVVGILGILVGITVILIFAV